MEETKFRNQVCKDNPFKVPDGYFARLQEDIMAKLPERQTAVKIEFAPRYGFLHKAMAVAASVCLLVVGVSAYMFHAGMESSLVVDSSLDDMQEMLYAADEVSDYIMLDNEDIYAYLSE